MKKEKQTKNQTQNKKFEKKYEKPKIAIHIPLETRTGSPESP